jgi:hypothetical protein
MIDDHIHVCSSGGKRIHPVGFNKNGSGQHGLHADDGWVETLDEPNLKDQVFFAGKAD